MISVFLSLDVEKGEEDFAVMTQFPVLPEIGHKVGFWYKRAHVFATVTDIVFDQQASGEFLPIVIVRL